MNKAIRTIVLVLAGAFALSSAGTALAAYTTPKLVVSDAKPAAGHDQLLGERHGRSDRQAHLLCAEGVLRSR